MIVRPALFACAFVLVGCAVAEDLPSSFVREGGVADSSTADTASPVDSSVVDSASPKDTSVPAEDTSPTDTGTTTVDTGTVTDTGTTTVDTGTVTDTGTITDGGACAIQGCITSSTDRTTCATARTIGRRTAGTIAGGYVATITFPSTTSITDGTLTCLALGPDHAYKIFMRKGETINVTVSDSSDAGVNFNALIWESGDCTTNTCSGTIAKCGNGAFSATADGWVTIMVSGKSPLDIGTYTIKVVLSGCKTTDCECP